MNKSSQKNLISLLLILLSIFACAKEGIPPGGPEDTTAPEVMSALPVSGATEVPLTSKIEIVFSEGMEPRTTEGSIYISPLPKEPFEFRWKGKKLILTPPNPLYPDRTYVISVGADAQDLRRNRLGRTYTFAFSTGSKLDFGTISGQVWIGQGIGFLKEAGASVYAYMLDQFESETDPAIQKPDYVTQPNNEGRYLLKNLSLGTYRLFAVQDLNKDLIWNWEKESIGVTIRDIRLTEQDISATDVDFLLSIEDKKNPNLLNCYSLNRNSVRLEFDEELDARSALNAANYRILSVVTGTEVEVKSPFFQDQDSRKVMLQTEQTVPREEYDIFVLNVNDQAGNPVDSSTNSCRFAGTDIPDTIGPTVTRILPATGEVDVPLNSQITVAFNEPPDHRSFESSFSLEDSTNKEIPGKGEWINPNVYLFSPVLPLPSNMQLRIRLSGRGIYDQLGNPSGLDSVFTSGFITLNQETLGSVSGRVAIEGRTEIPSIILVLWHLQQKEVFYQQTLAQPGPFRFDAVQPGKYFLGSYLDLDQDGALSFGNPEPFSPMEPFEVYADTINVRSRWETEGVEIEF